MADYTFLADLPDPDLDQLLHGAPRRHHVNGSVIFLEGEPGAVAYIVHQGAVDLTLTSIEGNQLFLHRVQVGEAFGEMSLLDGLPRSATAAAAGETILWEISREKFLDYLARHPDAALRMLRFTGQRLRLADEKIKALGFKDVSGRLARALLDLDTAGGHGQAIHVQHDRLADMVGSRRPTITTLITRWRTAGFIHGGRGWLSVVNREALEEIGVL